MKRTPEGEILTNLIVETFRLNGELLDAGNRLTKPHNLTSARWQVMGALSQEERPISVAQIARRMGLMRHGVQRIVNDLEKQGFVTFEENPDHKRAKLVRQTKMGENALNLVQQDQSVWVNALAKGMNKEEISGAIKILEAVRNRLLKSNAG